MWPTGAVNGAECLWADFVVPAAAACPPSGDSQPDPTSSFVTLDPKGTARTIAESTSGADISAPKPSLLLRACRSVATADEDRSGAALSRLQVLSVGLSASMLEVGVAPRSIKMAAGRLHVEGFRLMPVEEGMSRKPLKLVPL